MSHQMTFQATHVVTHFCLSCSWQFPPNEDKCLGKTSIFFKKIINKKNEEHFFLLLLFEWMTYIYSSIYLTKSPRKPKVAITWSVCKEPLPNILVTTLHQSLHCTSHYIALVTTLHQSLHCTSRYIALVTTLHQSLHCTNHKITAITALHQSPHCTNVFIAQTATLHQSLHCTIRNQLNLPFYSIGPTSRGHMKVQD